MRITRLFFILRLLAVCGTVLFIYSTYVPHAYFYCWCTSYKVVLYSTGTTVFEILAPWILCNRKKEFSLSHDGDGGYPWGPLLCGEFICHEIDWIIESTISSCCRREGTAHSCRVVVFEEGNERAQICYCLRTGMGTDSLTQCTRYWYCLLTILIISVLVVE